MADELLLPSITESLRATNGNRDLVEPEIASSFYDFLDEDPVARNVTKRLRKRGFTDLAIVHTFVDQAYKDGGFGQLPVWELNLPTASGKPVRELDPLQTEQRRTFFNQELQSQRAAENLKSNTALMAPLLDKHPDLQSAYGNFFGKEYAQVKKSIETDEDIVGEGTSAFGAMLELGLGVLSIPEKAITSVFSPTFRGYAVRVPSPTRNRQINSGGFVSEVMDPNEFLHVDNPYIALEISGRFLEDGVNADLSDLKGQFRTLGETKQIDPSLTPKPMMTGPSFDKEPLYPAPVNAPQMSKVPMLYEIHGQKSAKETALLFAENLATLGTSRNNPTFFENAERETGSALAGFVVTAPIYFATGAAPIKGARALAAGKGAATVAKEAFPAVKTIFESVSPQVEQLYRVGALGAPIARKTFLGEAAKSLEKIKRETFRGVAQFLPRGMYGDLREELIRLSKSRGTASILAQRGIQMEIANLKTPLEHDLYTHGVLLNDLAFDASQGKTLPFGYTPELLQQDSMRLAEEIQSSPAVKAALALREQKWADLRSRYINSVGKFVPGMEERLVNPSYFHHEVLAEADAQIAEAIAAGGKIQTPRNRGFLKSREGYGGVINVNYPQVEWKVMSQMEHDIQIAKVLEVASGYDKFQEIATALEKSGVAPTIDAVEANIPKGYALWRPEASNVLFMANTLDEKLAKKLTDGLLKEVGVTADDVTKTIQLGSKRKPWILPEEMAEQLSVTTKVPEQLEAQNIVQAVVKGWKGWTLTAPHRVLSYNLGNAASDLGNNVAGNPSFAMNPLKWNFTAQAVRDMWPTFSGKFDKLSPEALEFVKRGGAFSSSRVAEMGDLRNIAEFRALYDLAKPGLELSEADIKLFAGGWNRLKLISDYRENILRYANYLHALDSVKRTGRLPGLGASMAEELAALKDPRDMAFKWANDLFGRFDDLSANTKAVSKNALPFFSWRAVNAEIHKQLYANTFADAKTSGKILGALKLGQVAAIPTAINLATLSMRVASTYALMQAWNNLKFQDVEEGLGEARWMPHIVVGRTQEGDKAKARILPMTSAFYDMMNWFGAKQVPGSWDQFIHGRMSLSDVLKEHAFKAPVNVLYQQSNPFTKELVTQMSNMEFYPDVFDPRPIRDASLKGKMGHAFRIYTSMEFYKGVTGQPSDDIANQIRSVFLRKIDVGQGNYFDTKKLAREWMAKQGNLSVSVPVGFEDEDSKSNALMNLGQALRYDDKELADRFLRQYAFAGGTVGGIFSSWKAGAPLGGIPEKERPAFMASLTPDQKKQVESAGQWYQKNSTVARLSKFWREKEKELGLKEAK